MHPKQKRRAPEDRLRRFEGSKDSDRLSKSTGSTTRGLVQGEQDVFDGLRLIGSLHPRGSGWAAYSEPAHRHLGMFPTSMAAASAIYCERDRRAGNGPS